jgi:hypothetical protein
MWVPAVLAVMPRAWATCRVDAPRAIRDSTSISRGGVSPEGPARRLVRCCPVERQHLVAGFGAGRTELGTLGKDPGRGQVFVAANLAGNSRQPGRGSGLSERGRAVLPGYVTHAHPSTEGIW